MMNALALFNRMKSWPAGTWMFSRGVCSAAPYFKGISPHVTELRPALVTVSMRKHRAVENHLKTVHAIAMCNMAELAGGLLTDVSIPKGARWIPAGMTVQYLAKAKPIWWQRPMAAASTGVVKAILWSPSWSATRIKPMCSVPTSR